MKWIFCIILVLVATNSFAQDYMRFGTSAEQFQNVYDDRYVKKSGDTMEGELSTGGFDLHFDPTMFFRRVDEDRLDLYIAGSLIHTWESIPAALPPVPDVVLDLENGIALALESGIDLILE